MNLNAIEMPRHMARKAFIEYRASVQSLRRPKIEKGRKDFAKDDTALMVAYRVLAQGKRLVDFGRAVIDGGFNDKGLPLIAVVSAEARRCFCVHEYRELRFGADGWPSRWGLRKNAAPWRKIELDGAPFQNPSVEGSAMVPLIPPRFRPHHADMRKYVLLWEAVWDKRPPVDPVLLRRLSGTLGIVVAQWDLTELERLVMASSGVA